MKRDIIHDPIRVARPSKTLRELALEKMRVAITEGYFKQGDRLVERDICAQLGVSRTVVREVLRHLESEGLVATLANRGPIVAQLDMDEARQIYEIRGALEGMAARLCAQKRDPQIIGMLEKALAGIRQGYADKDMAAVLAQTTIFYQTLFNSVGRHVAWSIVNALLGRINNLRSMTIQTERRNIEGPAQMERIVDAIRDGDEERAQAAAMDHVAMASSIALRVLVEKEAQKSQA